MAFIRLMGVLMMNVSFQAKTQCYHPHGLLTYVKLFFPFSEWSQIVMLLVGVSVYYLVAIWGSLLRCNLGQGKIIKYYVQNQLKYILCLKKESYMRFMTAFSLGSQGFWLNANSPVGPKHSKQVKLLEVESKNG